MVSAVDPVGVFNSVPTVFKWTVANFDASMDIVSSPHGQTLSVNARFEFTCNSASCLFSHRLDGGEWSTPGGYELLVSKLSVGSHTLEVRAVQPATGQASSNVAPLFSWTVLPPDTMIYSAPAAVSDECNAQFLFGSGKRDCVFQYRLDGLLEWQDCESSLPLEGLSSGNHTLTVRAVDETGFSDATPVMHNWTISVPEPDTFLLAKPMGVTPMTLAAFGLGSSLNGACFEWRLDSGDWAHTCSDVVEIGAGIGVHTFEARAVVCDLTDSTPAEYTWTVDPEWKLMGAESNRIALFGLEDGDHSLQFEVKDLSGNMNSELPTFNWTIDTLAPNLTFVNPLSNWIDSGNVSVAVQCVDIHNCTVDWELSGADRRNGSLSASSGSDELELLQLPDGGYNFSVVGRDLALNEARLPPMAFSVDTVAPILQLVSELPPWSNKSSVAVTLDCADQSHCDVSWFLGGKEPRNGSSVVSGSDEFFFSGLPDGAYSLFFSADDYALNHVSVPGMNFSVDTVAPILELESELPPWSNKSSVAVTLDCADSNHCEVFWSLAGSASRNGSSVVSGSDEFVFSDLPDGNYTLLFSADDFAMNHASLSAINFSVDTVAPVPVLDSFPSNFTNSSRVEMEYHCEDDNRCRWTVELDSSEFLAESSPDTALWKDDLANGEHRVELKVRDPAGNVGSLARSWTVDLSPPNASIVNSQPEPWVVRALPTLQLNCSDALSPSCRFIWCIDGSNCRSSEYADVGTVLSAPLDAVRSDGIYTVSVFAVDTAGNIALEAATQQFAVDTSPPTCSMHNTPRNITNSTSGVVTFSCDDEYGCCYQRWLDGVGPMSGDEAILTALKNGEHNLTVLATDTAGNAANSTVEWIWYVDTEPPQILLESGNAPEILDNYVNNTSPTFFFGCNSSEELHGCGSEYLFSAKEWAYDQNETECRCVCPSCAGAAGNATTTDSWAPLKNSVFSRTGLSDGKYTLQVRAVDTAGNVQQSPPFSISWTVDTVAPTVAWTGYPDEVTSNKFAQFLFATWDGDGAVSSAEWMLDNSGEWEGPIKPSEFDQGVTVDVDAGWHRMQLRATDEAGNISPEIDYRWSFNENGAETKIEFLSPDPCLLGEETMVVQVSSATPKCTRFEWKLTGKWNPVGPTPTAKSGTFASFSIGKGDQSIGPQILQVRAVEGEDSNGPTAMRDVDFVCPSGSVAKPGDEGCDQCIAGTYASTISECAGCPSGAYSGPGAIACSPCPADGATCEGGILLLQDDYVHFDPTASSSTKFFACPTGDCKVDRNGSHWVSNSSLSASVTCTNSRDGLLCAKCLPNHAESSGVCTECWDAEWKSWAMILSMVAVVVMGCTFIISRSSSSKSQSSIILKILLSFIQMITILGMYRARGPQMFLDLIGYVKVTGAVSSDAFALKCATQWGFITAFALNFATPFAVLIVPGIVLGARLLRNPKEAKQARRMYIVSVIVLIFLIYTSVSNKLLVGFSCYPELLPLDPPRRLMADLDLPCYAPLHTSLAAVGTLLFIIGTPVASWLFLKKNRHKLFDEIYSFKEAYGFLYDGYRPDCYAWEMVVMLRKVTLTAVVVFFGRHEFLSAFFASAFMVLFLVAHVRAFPFDSGVLNLLEGASLLATVLTQWCSMIYLFQPSWEIQVTILLTLVNFGVIAACLYQMGKSAWERRKTVKLIRKRSEMEMVTKRRLSVVPEMLDLGEQAAVQSNPLFLRRGKRGGRGRVRRPDRGGRRKKTAEGGNDSVPLKADMELPVQPDDRPVLVGRWGGDANSAEARASRRL